jgi:hypothetical protein
MVGNVISKSHKKDNRQTFFQIFFKYRYFPIFLLLICFLTYGILIPWLHVFADDLSFLFYFRTLGRTGILQALVTERPGQGLLYSLTIPLLGTSPLVWQIFALATRWLSAFAVWLLLNQLWPAKKTTSVWITLLFTVFPGFHQHWVVVTYSHLYLMLSFVFFSFWGMLKSFQDEHKFWAYMVFSLITAASNLFMVEYYFGIELSRAVIIWIFLCNRSPGKKQKFSVFIKKYLPYLVMVLLYLVWRFVIFKSGKYNPQLTSIYGSTFSGIFFGLLKDISLGLYTVTIQVWINLFDFLSTSFSGISNLVILIVLALGLILSGTYIILSDKFHGALRKVGKKETFHWCIQAIILGIVSIFFSLIPFKVGGFPISLQSPWDRFLLAFMFSSSLLAVAIIKLLAMFFRPIGYFFVIILISFSIGSQYATANSYRKALILERNFFWQLSWRIPNLEPGTMLVTDNMNLPYYSENTLSSQLNYLFDPNLHSDHLSYTFAFIEGRLRDMMLTFHPDIPVTLCDRIMCFSGTTSDIIAFKYFPASCLAILDPIYMDTQTLAPEIHPRLQDAVPYSNLNRIETSQATAVTPSPFDFGPEPAHDWCYYFEKADLAKQEGDWQTVASIWEQAQVLGYNPSLPFQYYPFIEAYANLGDWSKARDLTHNLPFEDDTSPGICALWKRIELETGEHSQEALQIIDQIEGEYECGVSQ